MRSFSFCLSVVAYLLLSPAEGLACSCLPPVEVMGNPRKHVEHERGRATAVFAGRVIEIKEERGALAIIEAKFEVEKAWKGVTNDDAVVSASTLVHLCGYPFKVGRSYLVYASGPNLGELSTSICTRTTRLKDAEEDLKFLGEPMMQRENKAEPASPRRTKPNNGIQRTRNKQVFYQ